MKCSTTRPALRAYADRKIALGVRPEDMEDASLVAEAPDDQRIPVVIELVEALGSDVVVHFTIHAAAALTDDVKELAVDIGIPIDGDTAGSHTNMVARLNPRTRARKGEPIELVVDTHRLHFFDLEDSSAIYGKTSSRITYLERGTYMKWGRIAAVLVAMTLTAAACGDDQAEAAVGRPRAAAAAAANLKPNTGEVNLLSAAEPERGAAYQTIFDDLINPKADYKATVESSADFEEQFQIRADGGTLDVAAVPQPGAIPGLVDKGDLVSLEDLGFNIDDLNKQFGAAFVALGEYKGKHYGLPTNINLKSMVWYPKKAFDAAGYTVPKTWDEMLALSDKIVADGSTPWCVGFESGGATGWPATDWMEDIMLRTAGTDTYDKWVEARDPVQRPGGAARGRGLRRHHVPRRLRARRRRGDGLTSLSATRRADVRQPAEVLAAPPGELHQLASSPRAPSLASTTTGSRFLRSTRTAPCSAVS